MIKGNRRRFVRSFTKKNQKVLMKIEEMADVFLNSANLAPHAFLTLAQPSCYALDLKSLIKASKVSWTSQLSYEILRSSLERKFDKTNFISPKKTPPKSPCVLGLKTPGAISILLEFISDADGIRIFTKIPSEILAKKQLALPVKNCNWPIWFRINYAILSLHY